MPTVQGYLRKLELPIECWSPSACCWWFDNDLVTTQGNVIIEGSSFSLAPASACVSSFTARGVHAHMPTA